ncbi:peptidoglycan/LPS O-acetylase OafA/YrhL [Geodermatophilus bullaregiensis]|uniref:hypothetical protein n=1 Tax=Geodermatophilus bullaregiensis TaxID=1564160 RepID=UPI00195C3566|nr:hypothetical protein [Geodermatophilus bullaregiensis]MBM7804744.1 peptidoglycan/LPS O-acetylase OafA/YrhL [Geodermatophilus bullaregiensis]
MTTPSSMPSRMPGLAIAAAALGAVGVLPLAIVAVLGFALGGVLADAEGSRAWWTLALLLMPLLQLFAVFWLVARRGRWPLVLGAAVSLAFAGLVIGVAASVGEDVGIGPFVVAVCPLLAATLAFSPQVTAWLAGRPRRARGGEPA